MTSNVFIDYVRNARPCMRDATVLQGKHWRIGILTESLIRLEWSDSGEFEDRLTQMAVNRDFGADPEFTVTHRNGLLIVDTPALYLTYDGKPFSKEGLSIVVKGVSDTQFNTWHYGDAPLHNLKGTARTLDEADGEIALDDGVLSRDGWAVIDDSGSNVIVEADEVDGKTNSELVIPIHANGAVVAVLDLDSMRPARFTEADVQGLSTFAKILEDNCLWK